MYYVPVTGCPSHCLQHVAPCLKCLSQQVLNAVLTADLELYMIPISRPLTGMCVAAALSMIIPLGVCLYAVTGGLKATFTTSYIHTVIIFAVCCLFMFKTYSGGGILGSMDKVQLHLHMSPCAAMPLCGK